MYILKNSALAVQRSFPKLFFVPKKEFFLIFPCSWLPTKQDKKVRGLWALFLLKIFLLEKLILKYKEEKDNVNQIINEFWEQKIG